MHCSRSATAWMHVVTAVLAFGLVATAACRKDPQLDVQSAPAANAPAPPADPPAQAPAAPAPSADSAPSGMDPGAMPSGHAASMLPSVEPGAGAGAAGLVWDAPANWVSEPPANSMRRAQFRIP